MELMREEIQKYIDNPRIVLEKKTNLIFFFCGMGTGWKGMCVDLMNTFSSFKQEIKMIDKALKPYIEWSLLKRLSSADDTDNPVFGPIAIFACEVAMAKMLMFQGLKPDVLIGISLGEVAAAHIAGVLPLDQAVKIVYHRSNLLAETVDGKNIIVKNTSLKKRRELCEMYNLDVAVVCSPVTIVLSGDVNSVELAKQDLETQSRIPCRECRVSKAYHSRHMDRCQSELNKAIADLHTNPMSIRMVSTVNCNFTEVELRDALYWGKSLRETVQLDAAVKKVCDENTESIFIEVGPRPMLAVYLDDILDENPRSKMCLPTSRQGKTNDEIIRTLVAVYEKNVDVSWQAVLGDIPELCSEQTQPQHLVQNNHTSSAIHYSIM